MDREQLKDQIRHAFDTTPRPDNAHLRDSDEGTEPFLLEEEYRDKTDWRVLSPAFIDQSPDGFGTALSFFSREAFRYFLPAFLLADLDGELRQATPSFHLWHGLDNDTRTKPVNPRRYGDWTWYSAISEKFSVFSGPEIAAIVAYLRYVAVQDKVFRRNIEEALENYWLGRLEE